MIERGRDTRDYTDTVRDLRAYMRKEAQDSAEARNLIKQVEAMAVDVVDLREDVAVLRTKQEHGVKRVEIDRIAHSAVGVVTERVNNLWKFVTVSHVVIAGILSFIAAKVFSNH